LRCLLRSVERYRARQLVANPAQRRAELRNAQASAQAYPERLRYRSQRVALPALAKQLLRHPISQWIEVPVQAALQPRKLRIAKWAAKTAAERLTGLAGHVSEPAHRHVLLRPSVIGMRSTMPIRNLVRIC